MDRSGSQTDHRLMEPDPTRRRDQAGLLLYVGFAVERLAQARGLSSLAYGAHLAAWGGLIAGGLDCLENVGLLVMLGGHPTTPVAFLTSAFASLKFALAGAAIAVSVAAFVGWLAW